MWGKAKKVDEFLLAPGEDLTPLLAKHADAIAALVKEAQSLVGDKDLGDIKFEETLCLRYLYQAKGDVELAKKMISESVAWREKNSDLMKSVKFENDLAAFSYENPDVTAFKKFNGLMCRGLLGYADELQFPVVVSRSNFVKQKQMLKEDKVEDFFLYSLIQDEGGFRHCAKRTAETKRHVMQYHFLDLKDYSPRNKDADAGFNKAVATETKKLEFLHPMLENTRFAVELGTVMSMALGAMKKMMADASKLSTFKANKKGAFTTVADTFPDIKEFGVDKVLPPFLGGGAPCPPALKKLATDEPAKV